MGPAQSKNRQSLFLCRLATSTHAHMLTPCCRLSSLSRGTSTSPPRDSVQIVHRHCTFSKSSEDTYTPALKMIQATQRAKSRCYGTDIRKHAHHSHEHGVDRGTRETSMHALACLPRANGLQTERHEYAHTDTQTHMDMDTRYGSSGRYEIKTECMANTLLITGGARRLRRPRSAQR
jgi:hypothetical protein